MSIFLIFALSNYAHSFLLYSYFKINKKIVISLLWQCCTTLTDMRVKLIECFPPLTKKLYCVPKETRVQIK